MVGSANTHQGTNAFQIVDVTSTSVVKCLMTAATHASNTIYGTTNQNVTYCMFLQLNSTIGENYDMDFSTGIPNHIEDVLVRMHTGQWFGWSDASNKVYANLIIHDDQYSKPTEEALETELGQYYKEKTPWEQVRGERDQLLRDSDFNCPNRCSLLADKKDSLEDISSRIERSTSGI